MVAGEKLKEEKSIYDLVVGVIMRRKVIRPSGSQKPDDLLFQESFVTLTKLN